MLLSHTLGKIHAGFTPWNPNLYFLALPQHLAPRHKPTSACTALDLEPLNQENQFLQYLAISFWDTGTHTGTFSDQHIDTNYYVTRIRVTERKAM